MKLDQDKINEIDFHIKQKIIEALIFASTEPVPYSELKSRVKDANVLDQILKALENDYSARGVNLHIINNSYAFRTSSEISEYLNIEKEVSKPLSRAATETLSIIAYHQPVTRSEIENIRGVSLSRGTIDVLLELGWIQPGPRRSTPGNPLTWKTSDAFLDHFGLSELNELPGINDLKNSGLLDRNKIIFNNEPIKND